jgi:hypothetical protein
MFDFCPKHKIDNGSYVSFLQNIQKALDSSASFIISPLFYTIKFYTAFCCLDFIFSNFFALNSYIFDFFDSFSTGGYSFSFFI